MMLLGAGGWVRPPRQRNPHHAAHRSDPVPDTDSNDEASGEATGALSALPAKVLAGYWQGWGAPSVRLGVIPEEYNVILVAFAVRDDTRLARFSQSVQSTASFVADVDKLRAARRPVLLSVGGWD